MDPFDTLEETYWINFYEGKSERGPILNMELKHKQTGEKFKRPIWRSKDPLKHPYLGKAEAHQVKTAQHDDSEVPF